jgi:YfiH family protein
MKQAEISPVLLNDQAECTRYACGPYQLGFTHLPFGMDHIKALFPGRETIELEQTHSGIIREAVPDNSGLDGDGLISREARYIPVIRTADCIPLFFWHPETIFFGILHIGWRGFVAAIQRKLLETVRREGLDPRDLRFLIGPGICAGHYEVGPEVVRAFTPLISPDLIFTPTDHGKARLDLKNAIKLDLENEGIHPTQISDPGICTFEEAGRLPSHRRQANGGRIYNFIVRD